MNLECKFSKEYIDDINKKQPVEPKKENGWNKFWLKFGEFFAKGVTIRKWELKLNIKF